jgi:hypothetical protein
MLNKLSSLVDKWLAEARQDYINAERLKDVPNERPTGKYMIEYGARRIIYCAEELKEALSSLSPSALKTPKKTKSKEVRRS